MGGARWRAAGSARAPVASGVSVGVMLETTLTTWLMVFDAEWWLIRLQPVAAFFLFLAVLGISQPYIIGAWRRRKKG